MIIFGDATPLGLVRQNESEGCGYVIRQKSIE